MRIAILGYGKSGKSAERILREYYEIDRIAVFDDNLAGGEKLSSFKHYDFDKVVVSPGIDLRKLTIPTYKITSEYELAFELLKDKKIIGITGSNGKSTTTHLTAQLLNKLGKKAVACGNIGEPLAGLINRFDIYVVEFSSFQIDLLQKGRFLDVVAILNISSDHLDRYDTIEDYEYSKRRIVGFLKTNGELIINAKLCEKWELDAICIDEDLTQGAVKLESDVLRVDDFYVKLSEFTLSGKHNVLNLAFALKISSVFVKLEGDCTELIKGVKGLPHRCEVVLSKSGKKFINDSKATNVDSVITALNSFDSVVLLLGGYDKGGDFSLLNETINKKCKAVVCFGGAGEKIFAQIDFKNKFLVKSLSDAVSKSNELADIDDCVLLSPGCASFDEFRNFEERGEKFKELVANL